jgi:hypothetical protein
LALTVWEKEIRFAQQISAVRVSHSKSDHYDCCEQSSLYLQSQTVSQTV